MRGMHHLLSGSKGGGKSSGLGLASHVHSFHKFKGVCLYCVLVCLRVCVHAACVYACVCECVHACMHACVFDMSKCM